MIEGPSPATLRGVQALYAAIAADETFARVRRLMEFDWSEADLTVEELGLPRLLLSAARKLEAALAANGVALHPADVADAIRYSERHDRLAQDALWWLGQIASNPLLRGR